MNRYVAVVALVALVGLVVAIPGGWSNADTDSGDVQRIANYATMQMGKQDLVSVTSALTQVVAGTNYKLHLIVRTKRGKIQHCDVVVWETLQNKIELMENSCN